MKIQFIGVYIHEEFYRQVKKGMKDAAKLMNVEVKFTGDEAGNTKKQNQLIYDAVKNGVDGIAVCIIHPTDNNEAIKYALDQGVPVVAYNVDATEGKGAHLSFTQQNFKKAGSKLAQSYLDLVEKNATILITQHDPDISALEDRASGIKQVLSSKAVKTVDLFTSTFPDQAKQKIAALIEQNPEISGIFATGQADTEGAGLAVKQIESDQRPFVCGFDLSPEILKLIERGFIEATTDQQPYIQGFFPVLQLALNARFGLSPSNIDAGSNLITKNNVKQVMQLNEEGYR
jgi:simple sugar transport system substrate-binding protein